ncbi:hypothetical protein [Pseudoduganella lutea]|uniref:N-acetyltransferase n=1 Tax=Pseudoduganella lutea TaxID=321985 RepID=A0A4P6L5N5_9BURK|nr:hypothetical protein [Pseudoduganella lutea]QBE66837.1 hypothetical protein EWM63_30910 [Pseudoduganella lutea]
MQNEAKASKPYVRLATRKDTFELAPRLRQEDVEEVFHSSGMPPELALRFSLAVSNIAYAVVWRGQVIALFGIAGQLTWGEEGATGFPWMLASEELPLIRKSFLRECRGYVEGWLEAHDELEGYAWAENQVHIQWLRWLGFTIDPPVPFGINDQPFQRFYLRKEDHHV